MLIENQMQVLFRAHGTRNGERRAEKQREFVAVAIETVNTIPSSADTHMTQKTNPLSYCFCLVTIQAFLLLLARWYGAPTARKNDLSTETLSRWSPRYSRAVPGHKFPPDQSAVRLF